MKVLAKRAHGARALLVALGLILVVAAPPAFAQGSGNISRVVVEGNQRIEAETVQSYMLITPGQQYSAQKVDLSLKRLFGTGLFADVEISQQGDTLLVTVAENPIINRVVFEGNSALDNDDFEEEIELKPRVVYTRSRVQSDVQRIVELYRRSGRFAATVEPKVVELPQNRVDLVFEINEGPVTGVRRINFIGNRIYDDGDLRSAIATTESRWWKFFSSNDSYDPDRLTFDREMLRRYYLSQGYADFRVVSAVAELTPDREDFFITFTVDEGERYRFGEITVETQLDRLDAESLRDLVVMEEGKVYDAGLIDATVDALTFAAGEQGYAFVDVRPRVRRDREGKLIKISFSMDEGPRVYVERININGNTRTLDRVVRREMQLVEGDAFNRVLLDRSKSRIRGLGYFSEVEITEEPSGAPDRTVVNVDVKEQPTGELSFGFGVSSTDAFIVDLSLSERNLLGRGQFLRFRLALSSRRNQIDLSFTEPYFMGRNLAVGFDAFRTETDFQDESSFDARSTGFALRAGFPLGRQSRITTNYTYRTDKIADVSFFNTSPIIQLEAARGSDTTSAIGYIYGIDTRDDPIEPTSGWQFVLQQQFAGLGGKTKYLRSEATGRIFYSLAEEWILMIEGNGGYIDSYGGANLRINDRFFKGGSSFRGFEVSGIGPRDVLFDDALGGKLYGIGTVELSVPLGLPEEFGIKGSVFTDVGTLGLNDDQNIIIDGQAFTDIRDELSLRVSAGVSVFWDSPFGPVRLDFAQAVMKEDFDETEFFRFSAGTRF